MSIKILYATEIIIFKPRENLEENTPTSIHKDILFQMQTL